MHPVVGDNTAALFLTRGKSRPNIDYEQIKSIKYIILYFYTIFFLHFNKLYHSDILKKRAQE
ncbi:MAG: hypothetical protein RLZ77_1309 [Bacteroidota bacterium]|jgi:hypothetical protein